MSRVWLIHWNAAEGEECAGLLRNAGHQVEFKPRPGPGDLRAALDNSPEAFVIDLSRSPSLGRDIGAGLRARKATRHVLLVFVGGEPDIVARVRGLLPDAVYTDWMHIHSALTQAPPKKPVSPGVLAGYSGTPLPKKLGIKPSSTVALLGAPPDFERHLGVSVQKHARGRPDVILLFAKSRAELESRFPAAARALVEGGRLWLVWPKKASGVATDLTEPVVRKFGLAAGWVDYKICAVDETWSGLLFARRRKRGATVGSVEPTTAG